MIILIADTFAVGKRAINLLIDPVWSGSSGFCELMKGFLIEPANAKYVSQTKTMSHQVEFQQIQAVFLGNIHQFLAPIMGVPDQASPAALVLRIFHGFTWWKR